MIDEFTDPIAKWSLHESAAVWEHHEDQSTLNTLEIDKLEVENLLDVPNSFKNIISPYVLGGNEAVKQIDFNRNKMLRVYWSELVRRFALVKAFLLTFSQYRHQLLVFRLWIILKSTYSRCISKCLVE